jgi:hypothetical protein
MWIYASAIEGNTSYYLVTGYFKRKQAARGEPRYRLDIVGGVYRVQNGECIGIGAAREVFDVRPTSEVPPAVLQRLANVAAESLEAAAGSPQALGRALRQKQVAPITLPPELRQAFQRYLVPE